ncbi:sialate O-acetylesterase [Pedobacter sp. Du54]|uniref:sialate O-acetylesterase n=1 Tax=Pedobacter anseongensis TaxID=3133439 RepID=UPI00309E63FF
MKKNLILLLFVLYASTAFAKVKLPSFFTNNMVLQQQTNAAIWGAASAGKSVTLHTSWDNRTYTATTTGKGEWKISVSTPKYGGPFRITISDGETLVLENVLIGEVWLCSGQSNMEMPLAGWGKINNYQQEIKDATYPNIRLLQVIHVPSKLPLDDVKVTNGGWTPCSSETVAEFSSTAYFFAREIYQKTKIPIGLIHTSWGGTVAEAWISAKTLKTNSDFSEETLSIAKSGLSEFGKSEGENIVNWQQSMLQNDRGYQNGSYTWLNRSVDDNKWKTIPMPSQWEKSVLPNFDGVVYIRKKIILPENWSNKALTLNLGALDDQDITYFDGEKIGETLTANTNRTYQIPANKVTAGEHTIAVRIFDSGGWGGSPSEAKAMNIAVSKDEVISIAGDWKYNVGLNLKTIGPSPQIIQNVNKPTLLYNGMIHPFIQFAIKGVIWYQGESNASRAHQYRTLFPSLIRDWRNLWKIGDFPFYFVQLANFKSVEKEPIPSDWAELRDAQLGTLSLQNTGMAVTIDIGNDKDIHPKNKQDVGKRLAFIALAKTYGMKIPFSGPSYLAMKKESDAIRLTFKYADGLTTNGAPLQGFSIAGADQKFYWANAEIEGNTIIVKSKEVAHPVAVRYAWANNPNATLYNASGLPASPFRTDNWKDITATK